MKQSGSWSLFALTLVTLARFVEGLPVSGTTTVDCSQFNDTISGQCVEYTGYPTQINGIHVDLYHYADNWTTTGDLNIAAIINATTTVLPLFSTFSPPFNVTIVLVKALSTDDLALTYPGTPCHVLIREQPNNGTDPSFDLEQTTTHELYHCVESGNQGGNFPTLDGVGWWLEGAAEYFANKFYQDNGPGSHIKAYDPNLPLFNQTLSVRASIFFQFLRNQNWDDNAINNFVVQQIQAAQNGTSERTIMSSNADLQRLFPIFAQKFSGLAITFPDRTLAQGNPGTTINETEIVLNDLQSDGQQHPTSVDIPSFTMKTYTATLQPGITYSIQWAPTAQDAKTVLVYQQAANISGNTAWTTFDPTSPIQIPIDCSSGPIQYKFLFTSTADEDVSSGQLTIVRQSSQSCSCNDVGIPLDPCLSGNWNLDLNQFQTYLQDRMSQLPSVAIANLAASGSSTFEFPGGGMGAMTFSNLDIDYDATSSGISFHTTIDLTGSVTGQVVMQAAEKFCWSNGQGQGLAHTTTTVPGLGDPLVVDIPVATAYASPTISINYTCTATSLQLEGYDNKRYAWALSYVKA